MSGKGTLGCYSIADGKQLWSASMSELGGKIQSWGYCESPLVDGKLVIVTPGGPDGTMAAFDKMTGKLAWQTKDWTDDTQYSSIIAVNHNGARQLIQLTMKSIAGVNAADGKLLWKTDFPGKVAVIPTPIFKDGQVFVAAGYGVGCMSFKIGQDNVVEHLYDSTDMVNHHGGVILVDDHLYGYNDKGGWTCMEFKTGKVIWTEKKLGKGAIHCADGMLYLLEEKTGTVVLIEAARKAGVKKAASP
jgi:outer membrane protein assembly factor BamB